MAMLAPPPVLAVRAEGPMATLLIFVFTADCANDPIAMLLDTLPPPNPSVQPLTVPVRAPVTAPVRGPTNAVAVNVPVEGVYDRVVLVGST